MLKIREKAKIDPRRKRFAMERNNQCDSVYTITDRDAETLSNEKTRVVAIVPIPYARAVLDALNLVNTDHNALLALRPAKRGKLCGFRVGDYLCSLKRDHKEFCLFTRKDPKR